MKAPERLETERLVLRRPHRSDAEAVFDRYANDADVTRWLGWPTHEDIAATRAFLEFSDAEWARWPAGPYLIISREHGNVLGGTGLGFETPHRAMTGYVLARDAWGRGFATEALRAMTKVAPTIGVVRLYAICHVEHDQSWRVLEKCGFAREGVLRRHTVFPNLGRVAPSDVFSYALVFDGT